MLAQARAALTETELAALPYRASALQPGLLHRTTPGFESFAALIAAS